VGDELDDVRALEAVPTGENQDRPRTTHRRELLDQRSPLGGRELIAARIRLGARSTVRAGQSTRLGHLPEDEEGAVVEAKAPDGRVRTVDELF
jgi:hypothetical protein